MKEYKIGRYYIENMDQFCKNARNIILKRTTCLVIDETLRPGDWKILEVNFFNMNTFGYISSINTVLNLNERGITIKRDARINEIFEFWIGLKNCKDNEQ